MNSHFRMENHNLVFHVLNKLNGSLLEQSECYFCRGTAIALALDEYRKSVDIDFMCASQTGYRQLRNALWGNGLKGLIKSGENLQEMRETRSDQYGIHTIINIDNTPIKFEIVREARIDLTGKFNSFYQVPVLDKTSLFAEKLLANADRGFDTNTMNRDIIDISMMIYCWGDIPKIAWKRATDAYGERIIKEAYEKSVANIQNEAWLRKCMKKNGYGRSFCG